jgi:hypothetical protein
MTVVAACTGHARAGVKSGHGAHVWIVQVAASPARGVRRILSSLKRRVQRSDVCQTSELSVAKIG